MIWKQQHQSVIVDKKGVKQIRNLKEADRYDDHDQTGTRVLNLHLDPIVVIVRQLGDGGTRQTVETITTAEVSIP